MITKARKTKPAPAPAAPIDWPRADPAELAAFDPASKVCTMNCGPHGLDPRTRAERLFLCDDCDPVPPARPMIAPRTLSAVFGQVGRCLEGRALALEVLADYKADAQRDLLPVPRLRGFLQGLWAGGVLSFEDYCEVDALLEVGP